ncbi:cupredoxin domain-containing protein [Aneurinibacillus sp. REN35]|uniref:cupredoxin domain-containing protein n=1 Tax=Aneurinibacillus sp. REN35 TaxID=3237286 RepID=UPI003529B500
MSQKLKLILFILLIILNVAVFLFNQRHDLARTTKAGNVQTVIINHHGFIPQHITCKHGEILSLVVRNEDGAAHNFVLEAYRIFSSDLRKGESTHIRFVPHRKGTFRFISDTPGVPEPAYEGVLYVQ